MTDHITATDNRAAPNKAHTGSRFYFFYFFVSYLFALPALTSVIFGSYSSAVGPLSICSIYFIFGVSKLRQARQQQEPSTAPPRMKLRWAIAIGARVLHPSPARNR